MKKKILAMALVLTMLIGLTGCGERRRRSSHHDKNVTGTSIDVTGEEDAEEDVKVNPDEVTLTRVGEIEDPDEKMHFNRIAPVYVDGDQNILCNYMGEKMNIDISGGKIEDILIRANHSINGKACFEVQMPNDKVNNRGVYSEDGEELIACDAAIIELMEGSSRFVKVIYATQKTEDQEKAMMYCTESIVSFSPSEDDEMYEGYARFYDLKEKRMVPLSDITSNSELRKFSACGNSFIYDNRDNDEVIVYSADGKEIKKYSNDAIELSIGKGLYSINKGSDMYSICDDNANELFQKNQEMKCSYDYEDYVKVIQDGKVSIYNREGEEVIPKSEYTDFYGMYGSEIFRMNKEDEKVFLSKDGTVIYKTKERTDRLSKGVFRCENEEDVYDFVDESGLLATTDKLAELAFYKEENGENRYFIYNKKEFVPFKANNYTSYGILLATQDDETGLYSLYELLDGKQFLDKCNRISVIDNYVYAYKDGKWNVYKVSIPKKYQD